MNINVNMTAMTQPEDYVLRLNRHRILCFVADEISMTALRIGLEDGNIDIRRGTIIDAIQVLEKNTDVSGLIIDISSIIDPLSELETLARLCPPDVRVIVVGDNSDISFYRSLMELGVDEYLPKPLTRDLVQSHISQKLIGNQETKITDRSGHIISICGAQGGAGATSIAINLALLLAETTKGKVALLDLHLQGGETSIMLGVQPGPGLRIALENPMRADSLFIERSAIEINSRTKLFSADEDLDTSLEIKQEGVEHVLNLLQQKFNYIVVDVPIPLAPAIQPAITMSRHVLVLLEAEVTGLRNAQALRTAIKKLIGKNKVFTLVNRADRSGGLPLETIELGLGTKPDMLIPDLGKGMTEAVNLGIPGLEHVPKLRRHLAPIIREITGIDDQKKGWLRRLLGK